MTHSDSEHVPAAPGAPRPPAAQPITAVPGALHFEHRGRILEVQGSAVRVIADLGTVEQAPAGAAHVDLPPRLRRTAGGSVLDHFRLDLSTLQVRTVRTTGVSPSMIARTLCSYREDVGLTRDQAALLLEAHLQRRGYPDLAASLPEAATARRFAAGELAAMMRSPRLAWFPWWARTYDVATDRIKLLPGDEQYGPHLLKMLALRDVLSGEALEQAETLMKAMTDDEEMLRVPALARLATPLRLMLAARGEAALLDLLGRSRTLSQAAEDAVGFVRDDLTEGGVAHDRLQAAAQTLVRNPSKRPVLISSGIADLYLFTGGARLLLPGSAESMAIMVRGDAHLITHENDFRNAAQIIRVQDLEVRSGHLRLRASRVLLQDGAVHHDDRTFTVERQSDGTHHLTTLNMLKPGRVARVRKVPPGRTGLPDMVQALSGLRLSQAETLTYLTADDDLPF